MKRERGASTIGILGIMAILFSLIGPFLTGVMSTYYARAVTQAAADAASLAAAGQLAHSLSTTVSAPSVAAAARIELAREQALTTDAAQTIAASYAARNGASLRPSSFRVSPDTNARAAIPGVHTAMPTLDVQLTCQRAVPPPVRLSVHLTMSAPSMARAWLAQVLVSGKPGAFHVRFVWKVRLALPTG